MRLIRSAILVLLAVAAPAGAKELQTVSKAFTARGAEIIKVEYPAGDLTITTTDGDSVYATMTARCSHDYEQCAKRAAKVRLTSNLVGKTLHLELEGMSKLNHHGFSVDLEVSVPRLMAVGVDMGAGDVTVRGAERDVAVHLGAGDVNVRMAERTVRSVRAEVGVGDATLHRASSGINGSGFISKTLRWTHGPGAARVRVELGVGDVDVRLE